MKLSLRKSLGLFLILGLSPSLFAEGVKKESADGKALKHLIGASDGTRALAWDKALHVELANPSEQADYMALLQVIASKSSPQRQLVRHEPLLLRIATGQFERALSIAEKANVDPTNNSIHDSMSMSLKYDGSQDLRKKRGQISPPVSAPLKTKFGVEKLKGTIAELRHTGISFDVSEGTSVSSIGKGLVIFAREFDGFGKMIIIDHGSGFHSLYANLSKISVTQGEKIAIQQGIGQSGKNDDGEASLYFEIRLKGDAVDPEPFLSL